MSWVNRQDSPEALGDASVTTSAVGTQDLIRKEAKFLNKDERDKTSTVAALMGSIHDELVLNQLGPQKTKV